MKKRFNSGLAAAALTIALHAAVLAALAVQAPPIMSPGTSAAAPVFQVSLSAPQGQQSVAAPPVASDGEALAPAGHNDNVGKEVPQATGTPGTVTATESEWGDLLPQLSNTPLLTNLPLFGVPAYLPSSELQLRPSPETPVIIPFPDAQLGKQKATAILLLYISSEGVVDRVEIDESELPSEFEQAAIATFLQAKMRPGIKDGKAVPARMKIEVEFEAK